MDCCHQVPCIMHDRLSPLRDERRATGTCFTRESSHRRVGEHDIAGVRESDPDPDAECAIDDVLRETTAHGDANEREQRSV